MTENLLEAPEREAIEAVLKKSTDFAKAPTFEKLLGFLAGAVITPGGFEPSDWLQPLFKLNGIVFKDVEDLDSMMAALIPLYDRVDALRLRKEKLCPFNLDDVEVIKDPQPVIDWATGLHYAVSWQEDIWIPYEGEADYVDDKLKVEVNLNTQSLAALADPSSIPEIVKDPVPFQRNILSHLPDWREDMLCETWNDELKELFKLFCIGRLDAIMDAFQRYATAYDEGDFDVADIREVMSRADDE